MAKFSIAGDEDGAGTSSGPRRKRTRISLSDRSPQNHETQQSLEEDEEEQHVDEIVEEAEGQSGVRIEPYVEDVLYSNGSDYSSEIMVFRRKPKTIGSIRSPPLVLTDPEVLDCPICFEPLIIPVFQV